MNTTAATPYPTTAKPTFDVLVMATMSAGKSTLINAMIGQELLHTANEATTACHTRIEHKRRAKSFTGAGFSSSGQLLIKQSNISAADMRDWNTSKNIERIDLVGNFKTQPSPIPYIVLHDTPGPNNSQNSRHAQSAYDTFEDLPFNALLYVLNASQLGTNDDSRLLKHLHKSMASKSGRSIYFILNKVDLLDEGKGEDLSQYVKNAKSYLESIGFIDPVIIPSIASTALYARKALANETLTRKQHIQLQQALHELQQDKRTLLNSTSAPSSVLKKVFRRLENLEKSHAVGSTKKRKMEKNELKQLVVCSGLAILENLIENKFKSSNLA